MNRNRIWKALVALAVALHTVPALAGGALFTLSSDANCDGTIGVVDVQLAILGALDVPLDESVDADGNGVHDDCTPTVAQCIYTPTGVGGLCSDADPCPLTGSSWCINGTEEQVGNTGVCSGGFCQTVRTTTVCEFGCVGSGGCAQCSNDVNCDDGNLCTVDTCIGGQCEHNSAVNCDDGDNCTTDVCNPLTGACISYVENESCVSCNSDADCSDSDACTEDLCNPLTGQCINYDDGLCGNACEVNIQCYAAQQVCTEDDVCIDIEFMPEVGDGDVCNSDADCDGSPWGPFCVDSGQAEVAFGTLGYCQECPGTGQFFDLCPEGMSCSWGLSWQMEHPDTDEQLPRSVYMCTEPLGG